MIAKTLSKLIALSAILALTPVAFADEPAVGGDSENQAEAQRTLTGVIKEKADTYLVVIQDEGQGDTKITLSEAVLITKDDLPVDRTELLPGVEVEVKVKGPADAPEGVAIKILTKKPEPALGENP